MNEPQPIGYNIYDGVGFDTVKWATIPIGPDNLVGRLLMWTEDRGPWWKRIWRGHWRRYAHRSKWFEGSGIACKWPRE